MERYIYDESSFYEVNIYFNIFLNILIRFSDFAKRRKEIVGDKNYFDASPRMKKMN